MKSDCSIIMAILQEKRVETAIRVQEVLTKYGCYIRVRLGLHDSAVNECSNSGIIILQLCADNLAISNMENELQGIPNVKVKYMTLEFQKKMKKASIFSNKLRKQALLLVTECID